MAERSEHAVLSHLIETCCDAERGFRAAAETARTSEAKNVFLQLAQQRHDFAEQLLPYASAGEDGAISRGSRSAALHRTWMHLTARLAANPERMLVKEASRGERFAFAAYDAADGDVLSPEARRLVEMQKFCVRIARCLLTQIAPH